jgi:hypothetical protein
MHVVNNYRQMYSSKMDNHHGTSFPLHDIMYVAAAATTETANLLKMITVWQSLQAITDKTSNRPFEELK